jgi:hypothetical protein
MMLANAYLNSEQYELCEQICTYMNKTFPNDNSVQIVSLLHNTRSFFFLINKKLDDGKLFIT